jgi:Tfp pilus assembly protein PilF
MSQDNHKTHGYLLELFLSLALVLLTLLVYSRSFSYPFVEYDDPAYVYKNPHVQNGLTADSVRWAFTTFDCGNWHPLTWLSLQLDSAIYGGLNAGRFHLTNVLLHTANTLLLFLALRGLTGAVGRSAFVAGLFAVHPLHVESVAWVAERKDVLSALFWMLTLAAYLYYVRRPSVRRYLLVVLALMLGLLAKQMLVTLPFVLLLLDYWPLRRWPRDPATAPSTTDPPTASFGRLLLEKLPLVAVIVAACVVIILAQRQGEAVAPLEAFPLATRFWNALLAYTGYLGKMIWPMHLAVYYPHPGNTVSVARALAAGALLVVITLLVLGPGRRWRYLAVGWLWYLGTLVPVIGLVQIGSQAMADRYSYVPLIGLFLLLTWGMTDLAMARRLPRYFLVTTGAVVLSACALLTWVQLGYWQSKLHLWEHAAAVTENNGLAHLNLGTCYYQRHQFSDAKREFEKAAAIEPKRAEPHVNLGNVLADLERWEQAAAEYRTAINLDPDQATPHFGLANVLVEMGRLDEAMTEFRRAIALDPESAGPHNNVGNVLRDFGRLEEAQDEYQRAIDLDPKDALAHNNRGIVLVELSRPEDAIAEFHKAIALAPKNAQPHNNLGRAFQEEGRFEEALSEYQRAMDLGGKGASVRLRACERLLALRPRLPGLVAETDRPSDNAERLAFADLCRQPCERRYAMAVRLYSDAFTADPKLADDLRTENRFNAAVAAATAGRGQGRDVGRLGDPEKVQLRRQALEWLEADLAAWIKQAERDMPQDRAAVQRAMRIWKRNPGLSGVRDPAALATLTEAEREAWEKLWEEVENLLANASAPRNLP